MKYGDGFICLDGNGNELAERAYPELLPFEYNDGTGDCGWFLLEDFSFIYTDPTTGKAWKITMKGDANPAIGTSFDYDGASRPGITRGVAGDRMDHDVIVPSLVHDMGYCVHDYITGFTREQWDIALREIAEAYGCNWFKRNEFYYAVRAGGIFRYQKTVNETLRYITLIEIEEAV